MNLWLILRLWMILDFDIKWIKRYCKGGQIKKNFVNHKVFFGYNEILVKLSNNYDKPVIKERETPWEFWD